MRSYWPSLMRVKCGMDKKFLFQIAFIASLIVLPIMARRLIGDWADGAFIAIVALLGLAFRLFKRKL